MGAGAAGTVYRVKHKAEGGEVVFSIQLDLHDFLLCICGGFLSVFVCFRTLYLCIFNSVFVVFVYVSTFNARQSVDGDRVEHNKLSQKHENHNIYEQ